MKVIVKDTITKNIFKFAKRIATERKPVIIVGETGVGKTFLANYIHFNSPYFKEPFVAVRLSDFPETLLEGEVFGVEKGVATDVSEKAGILERVRYGTLCISGLEDISLRTQAILLRVIENQEFEKVGGHRKIGFKGRVIVEFQKEPEEIIKEKRLREDLFYRLNVFEIFIPPLRERKSEIMPFLFEFLKKGLKGKKFEFSKELTDFLENYKWRGNVREVLNLATFLSLNYKPIYETSDLPQTFFVSPFDPIKDGIEKRLSLKELTDSYIRAVLTLLSNNKSEAARWLKISRKSLWERLKEK